MVPDDLENGWPTKVNGQMGLKTVHFRRTIYFDSFRPFTFNRNYEKIDSLKSLPSTNLDMYLSNLEYLFSMRMELGINTPGLSGLIFGFSAFK